VVLGWAAGLLGEVGVGRGAWLRAGVELTDPISGASGSWAAPQAVQASTTNRGASARQTMVTVVTPLGLSMTALVCRTVVMESERTQVTTTYPRDDSQANLLRQEVGDANL